MKPVNLYPSDRPTGEPGAPNTALMGGAAGVIVIVLVVVAMTAFSRVDSIKSETGKLQGDTTSAQQQTTAIEAQIVSVGQPVLDSDKQLATNAEKQLVAAYTDRVDFKLVASELTAIMPKSGWYTEVSASATGATEGSATGSAVSIVGYLPSAELAAAFDERVDATKSFRNARPVAITVENLRSRKTKKVGRYYKFTIAAEFVDTLAPFKAGAGADNGDQTLVGGSSTPPALSLDAEPVDTKAARAAVAPPKPKNAFAIAAGAAGGAK